MTVYILMLNDSIVGVYAAEKLAQSAMNRDWLRRYSANTAHFKYGAKPEDNGYFYRMYAYDVETE